MSPATKKEASCSGKKLGHNFPVAGSNCTQCGVNQDELDGPALPAGRQFQKIEYFVREPEKGIHTEMHALAKEISEYCGEPKKFAMYLGIIKNIGLPGAYKIFAEIKQSESVKERGKLFLYLSSYKVIKKGREEPKPKNKKPQKIFKGRSARTMR